MIYVEKFIAKHFMMFVLQTKRYEKEAKYNMFSVHYGIHNIYPSFTETHKKNSDSEINLIDNC